MAKIAEVNATPNTGWQFINWTENGTVVSTNPQYSFTVTKDTHLVANFEKKTYLVNVGLLGSGNVSGAGSYQYGDNVVLVATPAEGYEFEGWFIDDQLVSTDLQYSFIIENDVYIVAKFKEIMYTVTVSAQPVEGGTVTGGGIY